VLVGSGLSRRRTFFFSLRQLTIALQTRKRVHCHRLKATDHGHTMQLFFTRLLRKTLVIDRIKVKEGGLGELGREGARFVRLAS
jgi:hypothetical protein